MTRALVSLLRHVSDEQAECDEELTDTKPRTVTDNQLADIIDVSDDTIGVADDSLDVSDDTLDVSDDTLHILK